MMRDDVDQALEQACAPRPKDRPVLDRLGAPACSEKTKALFVARLRVFLAEVPQDLTLNELLEELD